MLMIFLFGGIQVGSILDSTNFAFWAIAALGPC